MNEEGCYADLTAYTYRLAPYSLSGVFNVGWVDIESTYPTGAVPAEFVERLGEIVNSRGVFDGIVEPIRELPRCSVCGDVELRDSRGVVILNSELWIPFDGGVFASPILILHYVECHSYCPPSEYVDTVLAWNGGVEFNGDSICRERLRNSDWFKSRKVRS